jgi:glycosyltransferase involved in cell wall biosynthesis
MQTMISVVTPVHITNQVQLEYLRDLIRSFSKQAFPYKELIVSDDSHNSDVEALCRENNSSKSKVVYIAAPVVGISANLNYGISKAGGSIIKILFQDDFFTNRLALFLIWIRLVVSKKKWHVSSSNHFQQSSGKFFHTLRPKISHHLLDGKNYISSPSVVTFKKESKLDFCVQLNFLMDCEWYLRMSHNFGLPVFGKIVFISNRIHKDQATHWAKKNLEAESSIAKQMHSKYQMGSSECKCVN